MLTVLNMDGLPSISLNHINLVRLNLRLGINLIKSEGHFKLLEKIIKNIAINRL